MHQRGISLVTVLGAAATTLIATSVFVLINRPSDVAHGRAGCGVNMRTIYQAAALYSVDHGGGTETPELQGFSYTQGWGWQDALSPYGDVHNASHCPAESENLKDFASTYGFHLRSNGKEGAGSSIDRMRRLSEELGPAMPIVSCGVHDEIEAFYSDPVERRRTMDPFIHWIGADGKVRFQRVGWLPRVAMSQVRVGRVSHE